MLCWRDMTFCLAECLTIECHRHKMVVEKENVDNMPVAWADFSFNCEKYKEKK